MILFINYKEKCMDVEGDLIKWIKSRSAGSIVFPFVLLVEINKVSHCLANFAN